MKIFYHFDHKTVVFVAKCNKNYKASLKWTFMHFNRYHYQQLSQCILTTLLSRENHMSTGDMSSCLCKTHGLS